MLSSGACLVCSREVAEKREYGKALVDRRNAVIIDDLRQVDDLASRLLELVTSADLAWAGTAGTAAVPLLGRRALEHRRHDAAPRSTDCGGASISRPMVLEARAEVACVSDDMKEGPTLSSIGAKKTIYEGGWYHDAHRIRSSQEVDAGRGYRRSGTNHSGDASIQRPQFFERISQGTTQAVERSGRSGADVGLDLRHAERAWSEKKGSSPLLAL